VLYSGALTLFGFLAVNQVLNMGKGYAWARALPKGYQLSLVGAALFLLGGALDFLWHTVFGIEVNLETLLSPTHLFLATSGVLVMSGPLRALSNEARGWRALGPLVLSATSVLSILTFFTQFAHPINAPLAQTVNIIDRGQLSDLYVMQADGTSQTRLTTNPDLSARYGAWSPDGRQIVFMLGDGQTDSALYLMPLEGGGDVQRLTDMPGQESMPAWSPDGTRIAFLSESEQGANIYSINSDGTNLQPLTNKQVVTFGPAWSPDGAQLLYSARIDDADQIYRIEADGRNPTQLTNLSPHNWGAVWSPDGQHIAFASSGDVSLDLYVMNTDGTNAKRLTDSPDEDYAPTWSPDGRQIAYVSWHDGVADIFVMNADGSGSHNVTQSHALDINFPKWSPDGQTILFSAQGHTALPNPYESQVVAITSILLQSTLLMGIVLLLVKRWTLPFGALTFLFTCNGLLMTVFNDHYLLALPMVITGILADGMLQRLKSSGVFAFLVPVVLYTLYFLVIQLTTGIGWTIHLWLGCIFMAGISGWFVNQPTEIKRPLA
jgi:TolB protein